DLGLCCLRAFAGAVGWEAGVADLIKKSAVTDVESLCGLLAVPVMVVQDPQNDLALEGAGRLAGELLERNRTVEVDLVGDEIALARLEVIADYVLGAEDDVALDQVFELANIAGPMIFAKDFHQLG